MHNDSKKFFNIAAELFHRLFQEGQTKVSKFLSKRIKDIVSEANSFDCSKSNKTISEYLGEIGCGDYYSSLVFLMALDLASQSNERIINYIKTSRKYGYSLSDNNHVLVFPTYSGVDHYYKGYEYFQTVFHNLFFIEKLVFHKSDFKITNYYIDDKSSCDKLNVCFVPYPFSDTVNERNINGSVAEKKVIDKSDEIFLKRIDHIIDSANKKIPLIIFSPEMVGSRLLDLEIKKRALRHKDVCAFVCPSFHNIIDGANKNTSTIFVIEDRTIQTAKNIKFVPADNETIAADTVTLNIIHLKGFGKILCIICRDFLSSTFKEIIEMVIPDVVIVQCFTPRLREFANKINSICELNNCVIVGNACSAFSKSQKQKYLIVCGHRTSYDSAENVSVKYSKEVCDLCKNQCITDETCNILIELSIEINGDAKHHPFSYISAQIKGDI